MNIASIQARAIDCGFQSQALQTSRVASPMSRWAEFGEHRASWMWPTKKVFVRIESTDGVVGWACTNGGEVVALIIESHLTRLLVGAGTGDVTDLWERMYRSLLPNDRSGFAMMAIAGIDIALWDLNARADERSLYEALGGTGSRRLPVYVTTPEPDAWEGRAVWGLKAAMPFGPEAGETGLRDNVDHLQRFRAVAGTDRRVMLDAFMAWDPDYTRRLHAASAHLDIHWIEDPLPPHDLLGLGRVRRSIGKGTKVALGNFCFNRHDCEQLLREGLVDVLQPDVAWAGGITECLRILDMAEGAGVPVILHNSCEQPWALALAAACQRDAVVELVDRGPDSALASLMADAVTIEDGHVHVGDAAPGNRPPPFVEACFDTPPCARRGE